MDEKRKLVITGILIIAVLFTINSVLGLTFSGQTEEVNNSKVYLKADKYRVGSGFSYGQFMTKQYSGGVHVGFMYNGDYGVELLRLEYEKENNVTTVTSYECLDVFTYDEQTKQFTCEDSGNYTFTHSYDTIDIQNKIVTWNTTETKNWKTISVQPTEFNGFSILGHDTAKVFSGLNVNAGQLYGFRTYWHMPLLPRDKTMAEVYPGFDGKYSIIVLPDTYPLTKAGLQDAYSNGHLLILDPEYIFGSTTTVHYEDAETGRATDNNWTSGNYTTTQPFAGSKSFELDASGSRTKYTQNSSLDNLPFPVRLQYKWRITSTSGAGYSGFGNRTNARWDNAMHFSGGNVYWSVNGTGTGGPSSDSGVNYAINTWYDLSHTFYNESWVELMFNGAIVYNGTVNTTIDGNNDNLVSYEIAFDSDAGNSIFIDNINVSYSTANTAPNMSSVTIADLSNNKLQINANATDANGDDIQAWYYEVFRNTTSVATGSRTGVSDAQGILINIANYTYTLAGSYTVAVRAEDNNSVNSSWLNSSAINVSLDGISELLLAESVTVDEDADGTNYGETSRGLIANSNYSINMSSLDSSVDNYLVVRATTLDASINVYLGSDKIANIPSDAGDSGHYRIYAFNISSALVSSNNQFRFSAPTGNGETTYIDWIALAPTVNVTDGITANNTVVVLFVNATNSSGSIDDIDARIFNTSEQYADLNYSNHNSVTDNGYGNYIVAFKTTNYDGDLKMSLAYNTSSNSYTYSNNLTVTVDSTNPSINTVTTDLDVLASFTNYSFETNTTDTNLLFVQISANDSSIASRNLSSTDGNVTWNDTINYTKAYTKAITIYAEDRAGHSKTFTLSIRASNATETNDKVSLQSPYDYNGTYYNVTDTSTDYDIRWYVDFNISTEGTAYVDTFNISFDLVDNGTRDITITFGDDSINSSMFANGTKSFEWRTDDWNNSLTNPLSFANKLNYTLNDSITVEWENSGVGNIRLFHVSQTKKNESIHNISLHIPLRTTYTSNTSSIDVSYCQSGINWALKTCGQWAEITSELYDQNDETYHWGTSSTQYPTRDTNGDGKKDLLIFKVPEVAVQGEQMFRIDLDSSNAEATWTAAPAGGGDSSSGGGGGGPVTTDVSDATTSSTVSVPLSSDQPSILSDMLAFFGGFFSSIGRTIGNTWQVIKTIWSDSTVFFVLIGLIVIALILVLVGGDRKKLTKKVFEV